MGSIFDLGESFKGLIEEGVLREDLDGGGGEKTVGRFLGRKS